MKDVAGIPIEEGNLVQVQFGGFYLVGYVHKITRGGLAVPINNPTQRGVTPDKVCILFEINLADAAPGQAHPTLRRLCDPSKEVITPIAKKDVS
jgi:hypothetical protein